MASIRRHPLTAQQALQRAAALCARGEQSPAGMRTRLQGWGLTASDVSQVMRQLTAEGYIDEQRYAHAFVADRTRFNGWGRVKIAHMLRQQGIGDAAAAQALATIDQQQYAQGLLRQLRMRARGLAAAGGGDRRRWWATLMRYGVSRGFEAAVLGDAVQQVLRELTTTDTNDNADVFGDY